MKTYFTSILKVLANDGTEIGCITKQYRGFVLEAFTDADTFGITFPMNLDVHCKATLMGALFLIVSMTMLLFLSLSVVLRGGTMPAYRLRQL